MIERSFVIVFAVAQVVFMIVNGLLQDWRGVEISAAFAVILVLWLKVKDLEDRRRG